MECGLLAFNRKLILFFIFCFFAHENVFFFFALKLYSTICSPICCTALFQNKDAIKREFYLVELVEWVTDYSHMKYYLGLPVVHCGS